MWTLNVLAHLYTIYRSAAVPGASLHDRLDDAKCIGINQELLGDEETKTKACSDEREEFLSCLFTILCRLQSDGEEGKKEVPLLLV